MERRGRKVKLVMDEKKMRSHKISRFLLCHKELERNYECDDAHKRNVQNVPYRTMTSFHAVFGRGELVNFLCGKGGQDAKLRYTAFIGRNGQVEVLKYVQIMSYFCPISVRLWSYGCLPK